MKAAAKSDFYRKLPSVDELIHTPELAALAAEEGQAAVIDAARVVLAQLRDEIAKGTLATEAAVDVALSGVADAVARQLRRSLSYSLRPVINATGVILHTNLGRAPLPAEAVEHIRQTALGYSNLEFDIEEGKRGKRDVHVERLFGKLISDDRVGTDRVGVDRVGTGLGPVQAERSSAALPEISTIVVNNNAAAVLIALNTLAEGGEVIVSRGELVEIGGSFRIPDVMAKSQATLREVGTTNRTRIADYAGAITAQTRLLLRVHRS
ncbi:MAG TPA: hypothetical protein VGF08_02125, partial [Terriglobales bacterium]